MIQTRKLFVVGALVAASIAMAARDGITLRRALKEGTESYHMESNVKQTVSIAGMDQEMGMTSVASYSYKVGTVDSTAGSATVELTTKIEKFDADGPMGDALAGQKDKILVSTKVNGKIDSRNRFTPDLAKVVDPKSIILGSSNTTIVGPFFEFPEKPVNVGDSWDINVPKSLMTGKEDQKLSAKLLSEKEVDGKKVYVVSISGLLKTNINMADVIKGNSDPTIEALNLGEMTMTGTIEISGEANIDKVSCQTLSMSLKMLGKQEISIPALGDQKIPATNTATVKLTLDK